ncbi:hypothetical protein [Parendozoicomonas sp. Alg238-R29]|uniref:hypothetical protein n=1 Tax=Parendozoicomonas sp. Alg238-R29 TaxID=2993446 RepID=UPI00248D891A|nr:hypothetical protein [Parendozoicomonas sp. Alg238-R29]
MDSRPAYLAKNYEDVKAHFTDLRNKGVNIEKIGMTRNGSLVTKEEFEQENIGFFQYLRGEIQDSQGENFAQYRERCDNYWLHAKPIAQRSAEPVPPSSDSEGYMTPPEYSQEKAPYQSLINANPPPASSGDLSKFDREVVAAQEKYGLTNEELQVIYASPPQPFNPAAFHTCVDAWRRVRGIPNHALTFTRFWAATAGGNSNFDSVEKILKAFEWGKSEALVEGSTVLIKAWLALRPYPGLDKPENIGLLTQQELLDKRVIDDIEVLFNCFYLERTTKNPDFCMTKVEICKGAKKGILTDNDRSILGYYSSQRLTQERENALQLPAMQTLLKVPQIKALHDISEPKEPNMKALCTCCHILSYKGNNDYIEHEVQRWAHDPMVYGMRMLGLEVLSQDMGYLDTSEFRQSLQKSYGLGENDAKALSVNLKHVIPSVMNGKIELKKWLAQIGEPRARAAKALLYQKFCKIESEFDRQMGFLGDLLEVAARMERLQDKIADLPHS